MLSEKEIEQIKSTINPKYFDVDRIIEYLKTHEIVDKDVFTDVVVYNDDSLVRFMDNYKEKYGYNPVPRDTFIRRIPFYFFYTGDEKTWGMHYVWFGGIINRVYGYPDKTDKEIAALLEARYKALEDMYYHFHISIEDIYAYVDSKEYRSDRDILMQWHDYLKLCEKLHWYDYTPDAFEYKYNIALEAAGMDPIIYDLQEVDIGNYCYRHKTAMEIRGHFPVDPAGKPVLRWIGMILKNPGEISCDLNKDKATAWRIMIGLTPKTELYARNIYNEIDEDEQWYRLYAGPLTMEFDFTVLKKNRQWLGMTQREVAEAVGATLRTYQKWEIGETTPDSKYLLRLLNWLDIKDVVDATKWNENWDSSEDSK